MNLIFDIFTPEGVTSEQQNSVVALLRKTQELQRPFNKNYKDLSIRITKTFQQELQTFLFFKLNLNCNFCNICNLAHRSVRLIHKR